MDIPSVKIEMAALVKQLNEAGYLYYTKNEPKMTDKEYDALYDKLDALEKASGFVLGASPTRKVGYETLDGLAKVRHDLPMLSLDKTKNPEALIEFLDKPENVHYKKGVFSWKLDGITVVLKYQDGLLTQAVTRGNGEVGEDITHNVKVFKNVPVKINYQGTLTLRGEAVIPYSEFEKINAAQPETAMKYKNPRNLTSGTVRQLDSKEAARRNVLFFPFTVVKSGDGGDLYDSKEQMLIWLTSMGFSVVDYTIVCPNTLMAALEEFKSAIGRVDFPSDGLVLTYDSYEYSASLGVTAKFPRDSIAFKWADAIAETTILDIEWNTSRTGLINPVAVFEEVELEGTTVSRASLHNAGIVEEMRINVGDRVTVYKANMIIPQIDQNLTQSGPAPLPKVCPVCGEPSEIRVVKEQKALYCSNANCHAVRVKFLTHFVSRDAMNIEGLSEATIEKFTEKGFLDTYVDIYKLHRFYDQIALMDGFGEKSVKNLADSIEKSKTAQLPNFINALGIQNIGLAGAKLLCKHFDYDMERIINAPVEAFEIIDGFGLITAQAVHHYFGLETNRSLLVEALQYIHYSKPNPKQQTDKEQLLEGMTIVITGQLNQFKSRSMLQKAIEGLGGTVSSSVSKKTDILVNNDTASASSKNKKAQQLGVAILSEEAFIGQYLNQPS